MICGELKFNPSSDCNSPKMGEINNLLNKKVKNVTLNRANTYRLFRSAIA